MLPAMQMQMLSLLYNLLSNTGYKHRLRVHNLSQLLQMTQLKTLDKIFKYEPVNLWHFNRYRYFITKS